MWADKIYVRAGLEREKACLLVVIGAMSNGRKEVLGDLWDRGLEAPKVLAADGIAGLWAAGIVARRREAVSERSTRRTLRLPCTVASGSPTE